MSDWNEDIYQTPDTSREPVPENIVSDKIPEPVTAETVPDAVVNPEAVDNTAVTDTKGIFSGNHQNSNPYGGYGTQNQNSNPYGGYGAQQQNNNPYGGYGAQQQNNNPYGGYGAQNPYGDGYNNMYSPYAVPQKKSNTGLIITIVVVIILLFLIAVFALAYKAVNLITEQKTSDYDFDDYYYNDNYDYDYGYGDYDYSFGGYDSDDAYSYDYEDDQYYSLHNDIKSDLSYSVDYESYVYDTDYENVSITVDYPVIEGENAQNLDQLNETIQNETTVFTEYFEEVYETYIKNNEDSYFQAYSAGYVTYMDEDKMSIVFSEQLYADRISQAYLYCINIDMEKGVILDNEDMLSVDDDFSVDFRQRSDQQNGEISYLTAMTDQQITDYFNSSDIIVFYTPKGMEIGFNYEQGWVTVTYEEYEQYLKVF